MAFGFSHQSFSAGAANSSGYLFQRETDSTDDKAMTLV